MKVDVTRRGGIAGIALRGTADTTELPALQQEAAEAALRALDVLPFGAASSPSPYPDGFQFEIAVQDGATHRSAVVDETALPDALQPLVQAAMAKGEPG